jgi:hypothetical protein
VTVIKIKNIKDVTASRGSGSCSLLEASAVVAAAVAAATAVAPFGARCKLSGDVTLYPVCYRSSSGCSSLSRSVGGEYFLGVTGDLRLPGP